MSHLQGPHGGGGASRSWGAREDTLADGSGAGGRGVQAAPGSIGAFVRSRFQQVGPATRAG